MATVMEKMVQTEEGLIRRLKNEMATKVKSTRSLGRPEDQKRIGMGVPYREGVRLCIERARLVTEAYQEHEGEPIVIVRARALEKILDHMTLYIEPEDRIVGNYASDPDSLTFYPEQYWSWLDKVIDKQYQMLIPEDGKRAELHEILKFWKPRAVHGMEREQLPEAIKPWWFYNNHGAFLWIHGARAGQTVSWDKVYGEGLKGIIREAEGRLEEIGKDAEIHVQGDQYIKQKRFLEAAIITLKAAIRWAERYARLARDMAANEKDEEKKARLERIARNCDWVPANPPRTFEESLQSWWFIFIITRVLDVQTTGCGDRIDQIWHPFYKNDLAAGRITRQEAQRLVEFLWIKMNTLGDLTAPVQAAGMAGASMTTRVLDIGGQTHDGKDATNEMSYVILDATQSIGLTNPAIAIRLHRDTPIEFYRAIAEAVRAKAGVFSFFNDEFEIPYLTGMGIPLEDARNYLIEGCMRWNIPGKPMAHRALGGFFVEPKCLEYALFQGVDKRDGRQWGARTPDPLTFTSIEDVIEAFLTQVRFFMERLALFNAMTDQNEKERLPQPFNSALLDGCIERGMDCRDYKWFSKTLVNPVGQVTVWNSLVAMKKWVFEEKKVTMAELLGALKNNWEGKEDLRQLFLQAPKFGNDDGYVEPFAREIHTRTLAVEQSFRNIEGGQFVMDASGGASYYAYSGYTGATPDGRKDQDLFGDGTISPAVGTDKKGPTAVLRSVAKVGTPFNHLFNQKFTPHYLEESKKDAFISYLKTWLDLGIHHIQFNVQDKETFLDAQSHPENHLDLVVRVAGFSAYFIDLAKMQQEQIIQRTEQRI